MIKELRQDYEKDSDDIYENFDSDEEEEDQE